MNPQIRERLLMGLLCVASVSGTLALFGSVPLVARVAARLEHALPYRASSSATQEYPKGL